MSIQQIKSGSIASVASSALPSGSVLQVVYGSTSTQVVNSTTTYTDTGLTATITPTSATSKILVVVTQSCYKTPSPTSGVNIKLFRGATDLGQYVKDECYTGTTLANVSTTAFQRLDTPNTTSPTTYKTQFANAAAASSAIVQVDNVGVSTITLMEIAG